MSETAKHRHLVLDFVKGCGVDLGSAGDPVVPWAIQVDLPSEQYHVYNLERPEDVPIHLRGDATNLHWFKDGVLDWVHSAHLLEDFPNWTPVLREWDRVLKPGGHLIIAVPDHERFRAYVQRGADQGIDCDNKSHRRESFVGDLSQWLGHVYETVMDQFVSADPVEYSIIYVGRKRQ